MQPVDFNQILILTRSESKIKFERKRGEFVNCHLSHISNRVPRIARFSIGFREIIKGMKFFIKLIGYCLMIKKG